MIVKCPHCGKPIVIEGLGRKKGNYDVQNVLDAFEAHGTIRAAARALDMPSGTVWHVLKDNGAI